MAIPLPAKTHGRSHLPAYCPTCAVIRTFNLNASLDVACVVCGCTTPQPAARPSPDQLAQRRRDLDERERLGRTRRHTR